MHTHASLEGDAGRNCGVIALESTCCSFWRLDTPCRPGLLFDMLRGWGLGIIIRNHRAEQALGSSDSQGRALAVLVPWPSPALPNISMCQPSGLVLHIFFSSNSQNKSVGDVFFLISVLLRSDLHMIDCIHSKCTVWIFTAVYTQWNLHHHQCAERSHHAQKLLSLSSVHPPSAPVSRQLWSLFFFLSW